MFSANLDLLGARHRRQPQGHRRLVFAALGLQATIFDDLWMIEHVNAPPSPIKASSPHVRTKLLLKSVIRVAMFVKITRFHISRDILWLSLWHLFSKYLRLELDSR